MKSPKIDLNIGGNYGFNVANSAYMIAEINDEFDKNMEAIQEMNAEKHEAILKTAEFTQKQKELLEKQLNEVKIQNVKLEEANKQLKDLCDQAKKDSEESARVSKISIRLSIGAIAVAVVTGVLGILL